MSKTNKELAAEVYSAFLISAGLLFSDPNCTDPVKLPTTDEMAKEIKNLTEKLSAIPDN
ncbi:MAG: hypothetical protein NC548_33365 [Lachnospiraceae bacterium]|nr:hypothetical protein [Lachnospiraceae bacterium]